MSVACDAVNGVNLAQGICDTPVPSPVEQGAIEAILAGRNIYTRLDGIAALREAIAAKLQQHNGITADPDKEVLVTNGATGALYASLLALLNPGDEVIFFEPFYGYHVSTVVSLRMVATIVPLTAPDWKLDPEALRAAVTDKTRAIVMNTPANPSGKVFSREELETIAAVAEEHDLYVIVDEIYEYFVYDGAKHTSIATLPGMRERTITISGVSKTFSVTGWRIGYLAAPADVVPAIGYFHDLVYICPPSPGQYGTLAGLTALAATSFYDDLKRDHLRKREQLWEALNASGFKAPKPQGAYYILADASHLPGSTAAERARFLLKESRVAAVAGSAFFREGQGESMLRFCFGKQDADLERACDSLRRL